MRPFMDKESYWMLVNDDLHEEDDGDDVTTDVETFSSNVCVTSVGGSYFEDKVWRCARSHCGS